jgi:NAD kinase
MSIEYAIVVKNKTRLETLIERFNTKSQAQFYIERQGGNFDDYVAEHERFHESLFQVQSQLSGVLKNKIVERSYVPSFLFSSQHLVVVIGQDGLVANTAKYAGRIPIVAVNPEPARYDGVLLPFNVSDFLPGVESVLSGKFLQQEMRFAEAVLNDGQRLLGFNDLFIGSASHVSARYRIRYGEQSEEHSSSGLIVSTKAGSTGWMSSIFNMCFGITAMFDRNLSQPQPQISNENLLFAVREPFKSKRSQTSIVAGVLTQQQKLILESYMPANGVIFSDGIESDFLKFNSGSIATIGLANETAVLVQKTGHPKKS